MVKVYGLNAFELWGWCFWTVVLGKTLESPLNCKEIQPVNPKGNQFWIFIGRTDVEAKAPILWPPEAKSWLIGKDPDGGKDWGQKEKGATENEIVGWHHQLNEHEFEQTLRDGGGQGSLECCSLWGCKELDMTEWLNNKPLKPLPADFSMGVGEGCSFPVATPTVNWTSKFFGQFMLPRWH